MTLTIHNPKVYDTAGRIAIVGYGSCNPLGTAQTAYLTRIGRFREIVPQLARIMGLVEVKEGRCFAKDQIVWGRRVSAYPDWKGKELSREEVIQHYGDYIDRNIGIRVILPGDSESGFDPQRFEQFPLITLEKDTEINGRTYKKGARIRISQIVKLGACHAGIKPSGWDLMEEGGFSGKPFTVMGRAHLMMMRAAAEAIINMGVSWSEVAKKIPREQRDVAAANGMAPGQYIRDGMSFPVLAQELSEDHLGHYLSDTMAFYLGKLFNAAHASTRPAACNTGIANMADLLLRMRGGQILFGAVATFEAAVDVPSINGFLAKKALADDRAVSALGDHPSLVSRPCLLDRSGFVMGEGGGVLILMPMGLAQELGVKIYAELLSAVTAMGPKGRLDFAWPTEGVGAVKEKAILEAAKLDGVSPEKIVEEIDVEESHLTSTPIGDTHGMKESARVYRKYGRSRKNPVLIVGAKGGPRLDWIPEARQSGGNGVAHLLGGSGTHSSVEAVQILEYGVVPPTVAGLDQVAPEILKEEEILITTEPVRLSRRRIVDVNNQGFGDTNGNEFVRNYEPERYQNGRATQFLQEASERWRQEQFAAIENGDKKPADFLPDMTKGD